MALNRNAKELRRIKFKPGKLKDSTSGFDGLANKTQERCEKLGKQEMYEAQLAAKRQQIQKQIDIWEQRSTTNVPDSHGLTQNSRTKSSSLASSQPYNHIDSSESDPRFCCTPQSVQQFQNSDSKRSETLTNTNSNELNNDTSDDGMSELQRMIEEQDQENARKKKKRRSVGPGIENRNHLPSEKCDNATIASNIRGKGLRRPKSSYRVNVTEPSTSNYELHNDGNGGTSPIQPGDLDLSNGETENRDRGEDQSFSPQNTISNGPNDYWKQIQQEIKGYEFDPAVSGIYYDYLLKRFNDEEDYKRVHYTKKATNDIGRWMRGERLKMRATAISDAEKEAEQIRPLN
ncbi:hypothetical protein QAD02_007075 [Eretmocerus hayati]|uniref:Uncharacterized protein n=1 Tax=Eretmocerus hayati TaxID=131215 RepID=A0ACC2N356_9HYME|nr:hypothetical protein QAD02_007075 [Eretmocerus hayati]